MLKNIQVYKPTNEETKHLFRWSVFEPQFEERLALYPVTAPAGQAWNSWGFGKVNPESTEFGHPFEHKVMLLNVCVAERILPSKVIQQAAQAKAADIEKRDNRKIGKKELAQIKTEIVDELLPKSHVRVNAIPVLITADYLIVGTGSAKQADDCVSFLLRALRGTEDEDVRGYIMSVAPLAGKDNQKWIRQLAVDDGSDWTEHFEPSNSIALKGDSVIRIKDIDVGEDEVQQHISAERKVIELGVTYYNDQGDVSLLFSITDSLIIKRLKFSDILMGDVEKEQEGDSNLLDANLAILVPTITGMLADLERSLAGEEEEDEL